MTNGHFNYFAASAQPGQCGQKAVHALKNGDIIYALMPENAQRAAHILHLFVSNPIAKTVCNSRRDSFD
jgi:hypothetical protein